MKQRLHFITLGVENFEQMKKFYIEKFGWKLFNNEGIAFFRLNGFILSLYPKHELAEDIGISGNGDGFKHYTLAICFGSEKEVDNTIEDLRSKGVSIVKEPVKAFWGGYSSYIKDPENNYWGLAYNPFLPLDADDNVMAP